MKALVLAGIAASMVVAVSALACGLVLVGYAAVGAGVLGLVVAARRAHPSRWPPAETDRGPVGRHD
ncbi:hypothetical protein FHS23_004085 [Prauserella isguenensis]|uniref:Lipoprotein n=1 Tax=Prauserella isguenensis TaxID=1470180 RepID=A0A839S6N7_9PSEU|nr:hypothetical protein [Prauserella isguenensis]